MKKRTVNYTVRKTIRFTQVEVGRLESLLEKSTYCQTLSELVRAILFTRRLTLNSRNESLDQVRSELGMLRNELNKIGVNINQITHYFHMKADPGERRFFVTELLPHLELAKRKIEELHDVIEGLKVLK